MHVLQELLLAEDQKREQKTGSSLFLEGSIEHATRRLGGEVIIISPLSVWLLGGLLCVVLAMAATFASIAEYTRKEVVSGWLVPDAGAVRALALRGGVAIDVLVKSGDIVSTDQPIARIDLSVSTASGDLASAVEQSLRRLEFASGAQFSATQKRLDAERRRIETRRWSIQTQRQAHAAQLRDMEAHLVEADDTALWAQENFEEGLTTRSDAENWKNVARNIRQEVLRLRQSDVQLQNELEDIEQQIAVIVPELEVAQATHRAVMAELSERLVRAEAESKYIVTSPIGGRIEALSVDLGQTVSAGSTIAVLSPVDSELVAELFVPSRAAGFIKPGQGVRLKYDAFPFQRFGAADGEVISISRTILSPSEISFPGALPQEPVFRVRAKLRSTYIDAYGEKIPMRTGMLLNADIVFDRRSLIEWLLDPIYAVGRR